jgi:hypothetical protein
MKRFNSYFGREDLFGAGPDVPGGFLPVAK